MWLFALATALCLHAFGLDPAPTEPENAAAPNAAVESARSDAVSTESVVDLRTLVVQQQRNATEAAVSVRGKSDGTVEVRDASGNLLAAYPPNHFFVSGKISAEAIEKMNAREELLQKGLEGRKEAEQAAIDKGLEAAKEAEANAKEQEKASEIKWQEDFKAKSVPYLDRKTNAKLNAVKIDAREIREDGTYLYEGKALKPVRLFSTERKRYEMAIPVPAPEE